jgi:Tol biopolymer transport system component
VNATVGPSKLLALLVVVAAACTPPTTPDPVPEAYPRCVTHPICKISISQYVSTYAVANDGTIASSRVKFPSGEPSFRVLALVGVDDHWYREISTGGGMVAALTPDGQHLAALVAGDRSGLPDPDGSARDSDLFIYDRATSTWSRPAQPDGPIDSAPHISDDGRWVVTVFAQPRPEVALLDLTSGTWQAIGSGSEVDISADGSTVVWASRSAPSGLLDTISRYDRASGTTTDLGVLGRAPTVSGDGSRVAYRYWDGFYGVGVDDELWVVDAGGSPMRVVSGFVFGMSSLSADGRYLTATVEGLIRQYDLDDGSHADISWRDLPADLHAVSPDGGQVVFRTGDDEYRWTR